MKKTLTWISRDRIDHGFTVRWEDGKVWVVHADDVIRDDIEKMITYGISEYVCAPGAEPWDVELRRTPPDHHEFMERLADYLNKSTSWETEIILEVTW